MERIWTAKVCVRLCRLIACWINDGQHCAGELIAGSLHTHIKSYKIIVLRVVGGLGGQTGLCGYSSAPY